MILPSVYSKVFNTFQSFDHFDDNLFSNHPYLSKDEKMRGKYDKNIILITGFVMIPIILLMHLAHILYESFCNNGSLVITAKVSWIFYDIAQVLPIHCTVVLILASIHAVRARIIVLQKLLRNFTENIKRGLPVQDVPWKSVRALRSSYDDLLSCCNEINNTYYLFQGYLYIYSS